MNDERQTMNDTEQSPLLQFQHRPSLLVHCYSNISFYEKALGFDIGHFSDGGGLVRIDIQNLDGLNLRIPSGNEAGANSHWIPGGKTDGGVPEAILDLIPNDPNNVTVSEIK